MNIDTRCLCGKRLKAKELVCSECLHWLGDPVGPEGLLHAMESKPNVFRSLVRRDKKLIAYIGKVLEEKKHVGGIGYK